MFRVIEGEKALAEFLISRRVARVYDTLPFRSQNSAQTPSCRLRRAVTHSLTAAMLLSHRCGPKSVFRLPISLPFLDRYITHRGLPNSGAGAHSCSFTLCRGDG
jgi:hypothetical protein